MHMMKQRRRHAPGDSERVDFALVLPIHGHARKSGLCELVDPRALALTSTPCFWQRHEQTAKKETLFSENRDPSELRNFVLDGCQCPQPERLAEQPEAVKETTSSVCRAAAFQPILRK